MQTQSVHPEVVGEYHPPPHVARHIIQHAIRNIPNNKALFDKINPPKYKTNFGLKPHEYNSTGKLQFAFQN